MYWHTVFGLVIKSELELLGIQRAPEQEPDVIVRFGRIDPSGPAIMPEGGHLQMTPEGTYFLWKELRFRIKDGKDILIDHDPGVEETLILLYLMSPIFAILLSQRDNFVLHASAVVIEDEGVAFLGAPGQGKSTIAATLYARGHGLVGDDVIPIAFNEGPFLPLGLPQFKLWPDAVTTVLGDNPELLPQVTPACTKRVRKIERRSWEKSVRLRAIYVLDEGETLNCTPLPPQEAVAQIISHSYISRFGRQLLHGANVTRHLNQCTSIVNSVPVSLLNRPRSLSRLSEVARFVEEMAGSHSAVGTVA